VVQAVLDPARLRASFDRVARFGDEVPLFFYSVLFLTHPQTRRMFPPAMATQRDRLVGALGTIVSRVDDLDSLVPFVQQLGRDHRKFDVIAEHYPQVGEALLATLQHFLGEEWTDDLAAQWAEAYQVVSAVMVQAADAQEGVAPPWWEAEVIAHERRAADLAVVTVRVDGRLDYQPGQSLSVQAPQRPRLWRFYSPANAARDDGLIEFHIRAVDGGWVSSALVHSTGVGDVLQLGPAVGELVLDRGSGRDILMLAGGTGLAPLRAMVDHLVRGGGPVRQVHLVHSGRREHDLYDLPALQRVAAAEPWLTVLPVAELPPLRAARLGRPADVAVQLGRWSEHDVYVCGSDPMVAYSRDVLAGAGIDPQRVRVESFGYRETADALAGGPMGAPDAGTSMPGSPEGGAVTAGQEATAVKARTAVPVGAATPAEGGARPQDGQGTAAVGSRLRSGQ
jgi:NAD(P)H-flavin reductase/hemoglobin-like flavoprotein